MRDADKLNSKALALFERSLDETSDSREAWIKAQAGDDAALRDKALSYLSRDVSAGAAFQTGGAFHDTLDDTAMPEQIGAYKITELIGRGGMGTVYRGERASGDFDHDVAIKVVRPGAMSNKLVARFETERQTLAQLTHPHIARLYDGGTLENGAPYIVMEFIDGLPITEWANKHKLSRDERLVLFKAACSAVSHAHQNLIIHRDITPSNVLVDASGQVKLIDFGIAKPFDEDAAVTDMAYSLASLSFTPGFAAPERSKGAGANTLSDIYSLGKLLDSLTAVSQKDTDLSAIISKATDLTPEKRYGSVDAFIDDLNNYREGFPVDAHPDAGTYRVRKFISRHKFGTSLAITAIIGLVSAFGITAFQYQQAKFSKNEANKRFGEVRELANFMLFDLYDDLVNTPGNTKSLASIADKSREYLEALSQTDQASVDLRLEVAEGYKRLSDVTGNPGRANLGQREKAAIYLETAYKQFQTLHESEPQNQSIKSGLAKTAADFATHKFISEDDNEATRALSSTAIQLYEELIASNVDTFENTRHKLATAQLSARTHIWDGKGDIGISMFQDLLNQSIAFAAKYPENDKAASLNASIHTDYAETISWHYDAVGGDQNEALTLINASIDTYETLSRNDPENTLHPRSLLTVYYKRSQIFYSLEDWGKVRDDLEYAAALAKTFITKDPDDSQITRSLKNIEEQLVPVLGYLGEFERAIALGNENYKKSAALYKSDENNSGRFRELTNAIFAQATIRDIAGLRKEACEFYIMASENWKIIEQTVGITELDRDNMYKEIEENREACQKNEK